MDRKKIFWAIASVFIAILSIWTVVSQSKHFSFEILMSFIRNANKGWLFMSFVCTFGIGRTASQCVFHDKGWHTGLCCYSGSAD